VPQLQFSRENIAKEIWTVAKSPMMVGLLQHPLCVSCNHDHWNPWKSVNVDNERHYLQDFKRIWGQQEHVQKNQGRPSRAKGPRSNVPSIATGCEALRRGIYWHNCAAVLPKTLMVCPHKRDAHVGDANFCHNISYISPQSSAWELGNARQYLFIWNFAWGNHDLLAPIFGTLSTLYLGSGIMAGPWKTKRQLEASFSGDIPAWRIYMGSGWNFQGQHQLTIWVDLNIGYPLDLPWLVLIRPIFRQIQMVFSQWLG
jgi:hypothetical protein